MSTPPRSRRCTGEQIKESGFIRRYFAVMMVFAVLALILATGSTGWVPTTWQDWLTVVGLTPAGVGGVLLGDRFGLWLKNNGIGRQ